MGAVPFQDAKCALFGNRDVADLDQQPGGAGGSDAVQVEQRRAGGFDQLFEFGVRGLLAGIDPLQVSDEFRGDAAAGLAYRIARPDSGQQCLGLCRGQVPFRAAGDELEQQLVELGDLAGVFLTQ